METILTLAKALEKTSKKDILRLDIQYNIITEEYSGTLTLGDGISGMNHEFLIYEDGSIINHGIKKGELK